MEFSVADLRARLAVDPTIGTVHIATTTTRSRLEPRMKLVCLKSLPAIVLIAALTQPLIADDLPEATRVALAEQFQGDDQNNDALVSRQEMFLALVQAASNQDEATRRQLGAQVYLMFRRMDTDCDGNLNLKEIESDAIEFVKHSKLIDAEDRKLFEMRFSQCSYNAVSSVLIHFCGATPAFDDLGAMENTSFRDPLQESGMLDFHGWVPWTSYMVNSHQMEWNGPVNKLTAENFSCRPAQVPLADPQKQEITVRYADGERAELESKLLAQLRRGPVLIWTPYAAVLSPVSKCWRHVEHVDDDTDIVPYGPFTHAVACYLKDDGRVLVVDGATEEGLYYTNVRTIVATSSAMTSFVRIPRSDGGPATVDLLRGVDSDAFNVVVYPSPEPPLRQLPMSMPH